MRKALLLLALVSCKRPADEAARAKIFSPEQPTGTLAEAKERIDVLRLDDAQAAHRVLHMTEAEISQRLPSHRTVQHVQFDWTRAQAATPVSVGEDSELLENSAGDFSLRLANDHNQGFVLVKSGGKVFVKGLYGAFHERRTDRTDAARLREQALSGLATLDRLARGLKLHDAGETLHHGRRAERYTVTGFGAAPKTSERGDLPKIVWPEGKPDPDTAKRLELWEKEQPQKLEGSLLVDSETGVPLSAEISGTFSAPPDASLQLKLTLEVSEIGRPQAVEAPQAEPEPSAPHAVKDPLRFLGKTAQPGAPSSEEPEEDDTADDEPAAKP